MQGSCDCRTTGMFGETAMVELWDGVGIAAMAGTSWCDAPTGGDTSMDML
jgi:hypothetical protein